MTDNRQEPKVIGDDIPEAENELEDIHARLRGLYMSLDIEARSEFNDRVGIMAEQVNTQADRVRDVREDLRELADKWEEHGEAPDAACASELREVLEKDE